MAQNLANDQQTNARLQQYYQRAVDNINKDIDAELARIVDDNGNPVNAYKPVSKADMEAYQREAKQVVAQADAMRAKHHHVTYDDFSPEVNQRMKVYNATMRLNRLELLKSRVGVYLTGATAQVDADLQQKLGNDYISELKRQAGIMAVTVRPSMWTEPKVAKVVMAQTGGANFSKRLWANQDALKARLDEVISTGIVQGQSPRKMARKLKSQVKDTVTNHRYVTERIARTESSRVQYKLNNALRRGKLTAGQKQLIVSLDAALTKMPTYQNDEPLQRDYFFNDQESLDNFVGDFEIGGVFTDASYLSTSKVHYGKEKETIHVIIKSSKTGRDISEYNVNEQEVLFPRNSKFRIDDAYVDKNGIMTMVWSELDE